MKDNHPIDIVIPWVDCNDPAWMEEFNKYKSEIPDFKGNEMFNTLSFRYEDNGLLKYWFRCIERNAPWVNKIFFVTNGQKPEWLNSNHPKLHWIKHEDYIPHEYLPVYSSRPIELNFHRIKELSEHFIYFNDDMYLIRPVKIEYYFRNGLPIDYAMLTKLKISMYSHNILNNSIELFNIFDMKKDIQKNLRKWLNKNYSIKDNFRTLLNFRHIKFSVIKDRHFSRPYLKSSFEKCWELFSSKLKETSNKKFRNLSDVNVSIIRYYQLITGNFIPVYTEKYCCYKIKSLDILKNNLNNKKINEICLNLPRLEREASIEIFNKYYPDKSKYEL